MHNLNAGVPGVGGVLHVVPAQVHINGANTLATSERETDILDDDLPNQDMHSVGSLGTLSSFDGTNHMNEMSYQEPHKLDNLSPMTNGTSGFNGMDKLHKYRLYEPESVINGGYHYSNQNSLRNTGPRHHQEVGSPMRPSVSAQENLTAYQGNYQAPSWGQPQQTVSAQQHLYYYDPNSMFRSQSFTAPETVMFEQVPQPLPQAPARSGSSREAVQRGLNSWQQGGMGTGSRPSSRQQDTSNDRQSQSPSPQLSMPQTVPQSHSIPEFPQTASQQEIEQSIEALNMLMLDLDPSFSQIHKSQSVPVASREERSMPVASSISAQPVLNIYSEPVPQSAHQRPSPVQNFSPSPTHYIGNAQQAAPASYPFRTMGTTSRSFDEPEHFLQDYRDSETGGSYSPYSYPNQQHPVTAPPRSYSFGHASPSTSPMPPATGFSSGGTQQSMITSSSSPTFPAQPQLPQKTPESGEAPPNDPEDDNYNLEGIVAHRVAEYNAKLRNIRKSMKATHPSLQRQRSFTFSGVQSRDKTPDELGGLTRRRTTSEGQYENNPPNTGSVRSPTNVRSPVRCVSPEVFNTIAANPGGRPREPHLHSYKEAFEEMEAMSPTSPPSTGGGEISPQTPAFPISPQTPYLNLTRSPPGLAKTPLSALGLKPHNPADIMLQQTGDIDRDTTDEPVLEPRSYVESVARTATAGGAVPQHSPAQVGYSNETPLRNGGYGSSVSAPSPISTSSPIHSMDGASIRSYPSEENSMRIPTPTQPSMDSSFRSNSFSQPSGQSSYQNASPSMNSAPLAGTPISMNNFSSPDYCMSPASTQTDGGIVQQVNISGVHVVPGSPHTLHRTVGTNTPPSPGFARRVVNPNLAPSPGSPGLARHQMAMHGNMGVAPGSPSLSRHQGMMTGSAPVTQGSPSMDRHIMYGFSTPDERRPSLSRQSSASGSQAPSTPSFPVSPGYYQGVNSLSSTPPDSTYRQGSPVSQPSLPEKRRMSSGDRSNSLPNYSTVNGKASSPVSSGMSSPSNGNTMAYPHTLPDFSKFSMPDGSPETRANVKFVQDTSKYWYKPEISREQAITLLKDREPGAFVIRDSHSFRGAYGLAMKVATPPPTLVQQSKKGEPTNELVRHFLIETSPKGVKLKGCPNEPYFGCLSALVYQHSITPLALPCKLVVPSRDPSEEKKEVAIPANASTDLLKQGAACNVLFINSIDMESLTGPQAIAKTVGETLSADPAPTATVVHFKVSGQGITLTDNQRKLFFRRHYPLSTVTFCDVDPQERKWTKSDRGPAKIFGFVARKQGSTTDNVCHIFAELDPDQPAAAIVNFVSRVMGGSQKR